MYTNVFKSQIFNKIMNFNIIEKRLEKKKFETSVLLPIRQDKKVFKLLECLKRQKYKDFVLLIANDSKEPYLKKEDFPKELNYIYYHSPEEKYSTFYKLNFLAEEVKTPFAAITESDCEPSENWLKELIPIVKKEKTVIKGCEARPIGCCTANLVFPSELLKNTKFDDNAPIVADYEWGMNLEKKGHKLKFFSDKGLVFHNLLTGKPRLNRIIPCAKDDVYIAFKYKDPKFLIRKFLRNGYNAFTAIVQILLYLFIFIPYFSYKALTKSKSLS